MTSHPALVARLLARLNQVREQLGQEPLAADADTRFADALDSMGFVEFLALAAEDYGVPVEAIEQAAGRRYGSVGEFAAVLDAAGMFSPARSASKENVPLLALRAGKTYAWLAATAAALPDQR